MRQMFVVLVFAIGIITFINAYETSKKVISTEIELSSMSQEE